MSLSKGELKVETLHSDLEILFVALCNNIRQLMLTYALRLWPPDPRDGRYMHASRSYLSDNFSSHLIADQKCNISKASSLKLIYNFIITTNVFRAKWNKYVSEFEVNNFINYLVLRVKEILHLIQYQFKTIYWIWVGSVINVVMNNATALAVRRLGN